MSKVAKPERNSDEEKVDERVDRLARRLVETYRDVKAGVVDKDRALQELARSQQQGDH